MSSNSSSEGMRGHLCTGAVDRGKDWDAPSTRGGGELTGTRAFLRSVRTFDCAWTTCERGGIGVVRDLLTGVGASSSYSSPESTLSSSSVVSETLRLFVGGPV